MSRGTFHRRVIALVAAYGLALQGLLAAFAPLAAPPAGVVCSDQNPVSHPGGHEPFCGLACTMSGGFTGSSPPNVAAAVQIVQVARHALPVAAPMSAAPRGLSAARAPPFVG
jgi:hypothetical protein